VCSRIKQLILAYLVSNNEASFAETVQSVLLYLDAVARQALVAK